MTWPYRETGYPYFWGPPTAAENWCEEDYLVSPYIAEFINTLTNVVYVAFALNGLFRTRGAEPSRLLPHLGLLSVGLGSGIFHASIREWPQLFDTLSMILGAAFVLQRLLTFNVSSRQSVIRTVVFWLAMTAFGILHCRINNLTIHTAVFAAMILYIRHCTLVMMKSVKDAKSKQRAGRLAASGSVCAAVGFALWAIDSLACEQLRWARRRIGMPLGFVLEFHGWWHILTAISAHLFMTLVDELLLDLSSRSKQE